MAAMASVSCFSTSPHHQYLIAHALKLGIELTGDVFVEVHIVHTSNPCCSDYALAVELTANLFVDAHLVHLNHLVACLSR
jgi:hypothetical protein